MTEVAVVGAGLMGPALTLVFALGGHNVRLEVQRMLDEGLVTPKGIDDSVIHGLALRMPILGIMAKADLTGLPLKGHFDWGDQSPEELFRERDHKLLALKQALRKIGPMEGK